MLARRKNGQGTISFDSNRGKYFCSIYDPLGKRIGKRFDTEEEAEKWLMEKRLEIINDDYTPQTSITLGEWFIQWMTLFKKDIRIKTKLRYYQSAKYIEPISNYQLQKITPITVQKLLNNLPSTMATSSKKKVHNILNQLFKKALMIGIVKENVMDKVESPKGKSKREITIFTPEEIDKILEYVKQDKINLSYKKMYPLILLSINTGARIGELLALKWKNVDIKNNTIKIEHTVVYVPRYGHIVSEPKTKAGNRKVSIPKHVTETLLSYRYNDKYSSDDDYVFHTTRGNPHMYRNIAGRWRDILSWANIQYRGIHSLRHTNATQLLAVGIPLLEVARRLGHSKTSHTLDLYGHAMPGYDDKIIDTISELFPK